MTLRPLDTTRIARHVQAVIGERVIGVMLRVHDTDRGEPRIWQTTAGRARIEGDQPPEITGHFRIGSITKLFVATVALQLVDEGRLRLDDPVRLPDLMPSDQPIVTVRNLLQHTSGIPDYLPHVITGPAQLLRDRYRDRTPEELLAVAFARPRAFEPGSTLGYSNSNYLLLGRLITAVTGRGWAEEVAGRIGTPLGLTGTSAPGTNPTLPAPHARGYTRLGPTGAVDASDAGGSSTEATGRNRPTNHEPVDITEVNPSVWDAAGSIISTAADLDSFLGALLGGRLLSPALLDEMLRPFPGTAEQTPFFRFGLGAQQLRLDGPAGETVVYGGGGAVRGYAVLAFADRELRRRMVLTLTIATADEMESAEDLLTLAHAVF